MRTFATAIAILQLALSGAPGQTQPAENAKTLSFEQNTKISQLNSSRTTPLPSGRFSIGVDAPMPADVQIQTLPPGADQVVPQLHGYVVVEEQIALIDEGIRKVEIVFPRWLEP